MKSKSEVDVRPLDQREKIGVSNLRKGMLLASVSIKEEVKQLKFRKR